MDNPTAQANPHAGRGGNVPPKERQFGQPNGNPRNPSGWKREDTARYKLEQMMKLSEVELTELNFNESAPMFERKIAKAILNGEWKEIESMMNQVYGQPKQKIEAEVAEVKPLVDLTGRKKNGSES